MDSSAMASLDSLKINMQSLEKIESFLHDSAYKEAIENSETFNTRLCIERRLRMPFLDPQTGVAQYHSALFMAPRNRIPGLKDGQIYSYPSARWRKSRRQYLLQKPQPPFPAYTHRPFGHLQSTYDSENSNLESATTADNDSKDHKEDHPKEWYYDDMEMHEMETLDDHELPDSDCDFEESYGSRKKKGKNTKSGSSSSKSKATTGESSSQKRNNRGTGRGRGRKSQNPLDSPSTKDGETPKKNRSQTLPHLTPQTSSSPVTVPPEETVMPVLVPEPKTIEDIEENIIMKPIPPVVPSSSSSSSSTSGTASFTSNSIVEKGRAIPSPYCDFCLGDARENKKTFEPEELVSCSDCGRSGHPTCLQFTANMIISVRKYRWQCIECKYCTICGTSDNDDQLLFCDDCDRGYHMYCLSPPLVSPPEGSWSCKLCTEEFHKK
ncbi:zinc finger protein ubi-d4 [Uranotaenia lowii]|uniref:zinc finger protein ubi-d4 n=1 Tax=Uranotaenia lowii TaxID=190385 RepID=UPI00247A78A6|nr:zinc finger protein ubi-d4 [Uranotaenia lowii]